MSRRPPAGGDRAAQNAVTLKALVKLEGNKVCADCKRNKHPRWASWNLGVFVCIRCSGIHRGMGTHISRVKSVDLDAWTDEQLQSVLKWGNSRANRYWEAKLAPGHVPSEAKIENFIRTKYESKRWVMDGPMPDPATLDTEGDDNMPLNIVQEKAKMERSASQRAQVASPRQTAPPIHRAVPTPSVDLFGDLAPSPPVRPNTADIAESKPTRTGPPPPAPKPAARPQDSLLGLDFFGGSQSAGIGRPSSASSNPAPSTNPRGDLKNSILSLYASAPKPQPAPQQAPQQAQQHAHGRQPSFGGLSSPPPKQDAFGGLTDAFGGMNFSSTNSTKSPLIQSSASALSGMGGFANTDTTQLSSAKSQTSAFSGMGSFLSAVPSKATPSAPQVTSPPPLSGGSFFDSAPSKPPAPKATTAAARKPSNGLDFAFTQKATPAAAPAPAPAPKPAATSIPADLFANDDFGGFASSPAAPPVAAPPLASPIVTSPTLKSAHNFNSAFNLSAPQPPPPKPASQPAQPPVTRQQSNPLFDPWGSGSDSSPWGPSEATTAKPAAPTVDLGKIPSRITPNDISGGWGAPISSANRSTQQPTVTADEDFGGWTSASTTQTPVAAPPKPAGTGFGTASDPFDNPWG